MTIASAMALVGLNLRDQAAGFGIPSNVSQIGLVLYGLAWIGVGLSLVAAQPREGVLGSAV